MALTLTVDIGISDNPVPLSGSPGASVFVIDSELFAVIGLVPPAYATVTAGGSGGAGRRYVPPVSVTVERGYAGSEAAPHTAGATVTQLWPVYAATPGMIAGLTVRDGSHTVSDVAELDFTGGATVSDLGSGVAGVSVP